MTDPQDSPPPPNNGGENKKKLSSSPPLLGAGGAFCAVAVTLLANRLGCAWIAGTEFADNAFYDGSALFLTLLVPSLLGGLVIGMVARAAALTTAAAAFGLFCVVGLLHPFWRIPLVSPQSVHSGLMHYFLYNPIVVLTFGTLSAWLTSQFTTGRWTLADRTPVTPNPEDD